MIFPSLPVFFIHPAVEIPQTQKKLAKTAFHVMVMKKGGVYGQFRFHTDFVFSRQFEALAQKGDLLWGISTSGNSTNVLNALKLAKKMECNTLGFSGRNGGEMKEWCDILLISPSEDTPRIQEMHILMAHIICDLIEKEA